MLLLLCDSDEDGDMMMMIIFDAESDSLNVGLHSLYSVFELFDSKFVNRCITHHT